MNYSIDEATAQAIEDKLTSERTRQQLADYVADTPGCVRNWERMNWMLEFDTPQSARKLLERVQADQITMYWPGCGRDKGEVRSRKIHANRIFKVLCSALLNVAKNPV